MNPINIGHGVAGYYAIWYNEKNERCSAYFMKNELWLEYLVFKFGKKWVNGRKNQIEEILREVMK